MMIVGIISSLVTFVTTYMLILIQKKLSLSQFIRIDGPQAHLIKKGTPTAGGIGIFLGQLTGLIMTQKHPFTQFYLQAIAIFGFLGLIDDVFKLFKIKNGLSAKNKFLLQLAFGAFLLIISPITLSQTFIPIVGMMTFPWISIFLLNLFAFNGTTNATNLTDGLDGLLALIFLGVWISLLNFFFTLDNSTLLHLTPESIETLFLIASVNIGSLMSFLWFNCFKASIFMGDCGSLLLGAGLCAVCTLLSMPIILFGLLLIPVLETISVILQVGSFRLRKKRIFKMAPLHHHYEQEGMHEAHICFRFSLINTFFCIITLYFLSRA